MPLRIKSVPMGKASIDGILCSTGAYSCIIVVILLENKQVFINHVDSNSFNLEGSDISIEIQRFVRDTMFKLSQLNTNGLLMEKIYMIGGADQPDYGRFHDTLNQMKQNHSLLTPMFNDLTIDDLRNFINLIEYSNLKINLSGGDLDAKRGTAFISDITVIIDRKTTSNCFFSMVQYYGREKELNGDKRKFEPQLMFLYNFDEKYWSLIDNRTPGFQSSHIDKLFTQFNQLTTEDVQELRNTINHYLQSIKQ
ncbi:unnamed protein product [Rotaria sordida]|uniref:Uncharacterized protein n=1 Tax=Rotaria sordida TaxID=392033 RepID=A0A813VA96_9BILA|nr:unnamed protein product [Rotaria sordida]CAF3931346.1 unnamed protein product [Rotaria sordida]